MRCEWDLGDERLVMYWRVTGRLLSAVGVPRTSSAVAVEAGAAVSGAAEARHARGDGRGAVSRHARESQRHDEVVHTRGKIRRR